MCICMFMYACMCVHLFFSRIYQLWPHKHTRWHHTLITSHYYSFLSFLICSSDLSSYKLFFFIFWKKGSFVGGCEGVVSSVSLVSLVPHARNSFFLSLSMCGECVVESVGLYRAIQLFIEMSVLLGADIIYPQIVSKLTTLNS